MIVWKHLLYFRYKENLDTFEAKSDIEIFLGYYANTRAYRVFNMRNYIVMKSINVVIGDSRATNMAGCEDSDVFERWKITKVGTSSRDLLIDVTTTEPSKDNEDEEKGYSLPK